MSMTDQFATCDDIPEVDMELLFQYCRYSALFPTKLLHTNGISNMWQDFVRSLMAVDPRERPSAGDALNSRCFTELDLEMLRNQLGLLLTVEFRSAAITVILESEPGVLVAILHSFGGTTIQELHRKATDMGFLEVVWLVGGTALETYFNGDLTSLRLPPWYGQIDMMNVMRDCGAFINDQYGDSWRETILQKSAADGYLDVVKLLIAQGAEINTKGDWGGMASPALLSAAENGHVDVVKLLIAHGAEINRKGDWGGISSPALLSAAETGHVDVVKLLIATGADVNAVPADFLDLRPLRAAAQNGHVDVVKLLIADGADVNASWGLYGSVTALQSAAEYGQVDAIRVLLSHGANVDAIFSGQAALHIAAGKGQVDSIRVLLAHGADVNANYRGWTALHDAAEKGHVDAIKVLLAYGADFDEQDKGWPALQTAVVHDQVDAIRVLLAHGAEVGGEDSGRTSLHEVVWTAYGPPSVNYLGDSSPPMFGMRPVDYMRDVQEGRKRWTPLQLAATNCHRDAITVLLAHGLGMVSQTGATADMMSG